MDNIGQRVFDPPTISTKTTASIQNAKTTAASLSLGIPVLNEYVMARRNKVNGILADTSQGKTSIKSYIARKMAEQIDADNGEVGVYVTWEDTIEDFGMSDIAYYSKIPLASLYHGDVKENEYKRMMRAGIERAKTPLWLIGVSESVNAVQQPMTMTDVFEAMDYIVNKQNRKVRFVMLDYLQRINRDDTRERDARMQYSAVMDKIKTLALSYHPAVFVSSQVTRSKVESHKWRQPQIHWAMETANFEHTCDGAFSIWMPWKSKDVWNDGDCLQEKKSPEDKAIFVRKETMLLEILKQKKADTGQVKAVDFLPEYNMFVPYDTADEARNKIKAEAGNV